MKIRAIELTNIRRFAGQTARIEGIGDGITVLSEPNEFGKSTFFDALHALFFERHRGAKAAVKALQPHAGGAPEVALEVDLPQGRFRIEKRWLNRATARILQDGRILAQDDEAEAWIDRLLGGGGPMGLLWVRQGLVGMEPEGNSASEKGEKERGLSARRDLLSSVAGEIDMMTGGRRLDGVVAKVGAELARLATSTGRPKAGGEWARATDEAAALRVQEADLAAKAARLSGDLARRADVQRSLRDLDDPEADRARRDALEAARHADAAARAHVEKVAEAEKGAKLARLTEEQGQGAIQRLERLSERLAGAEAELVGVRAKAAQAEVRAADLGARDAAAAAALTDAQGRTQAVRARLDAVQRARLALAARERAAGLARVLTRAEALRQTAEGDRARRSLLTVTPKAIALAEEARAAHDRAEAQLAAQAVTVTLRYDGAARVRADGADLAEGAHRLTSGRAFDLPGIGAMTVDPGAGGAGDLAARLAEAAAALATRLAACGAATLPEARAKLTEAQRLDEALRGTDALLAELAPDGLDALRQALARAEAEGGDGPAEDPAALEAELTAATADEHRHRDAWTEAHAALNAAAEARAGARSTLQSAERNAEGARAEAGDLGALAAELHRLRAETTAHQARRAEADAVFDALNRTAPDLAMVAAALSRAQSVVTQTQTTRERLSTELATLNGGINALAEQGIEEQLAEVQGRLAASAARADRYASEVLALTRLRGALEDARRRARDAYFGPVLRELEPLLSVIHPGAALQIDDQTLLPIALTRNGQHEPLEILSGGTREQVAVLTRLAFARLFARTGTAVPVILDDALVHSDDDRIEAMFTALHRVAQDQQIIVLTCRQRAFAALGGERAQAVIRAV